ncbi:MAG: hypothetical protein LBJ01_04915 [Tannerella sp.]|jgi:phage shock protein PspC (stress-responsive transcriptional regulator)|nr:hypothetical protein [Tannerella sp.]
MRKKISWVHFNLSCAVVARNEAIQVILYWIASCFVPRSRNDGARRAVLQRQAVVCRPCESKYPENKQKKMTKISDWQSITPARRSVPLRRVKSKAPALRRNHAPHETPSEQNIYTRDRRKAGALLLTRRSGTLRRAGVHGALSCNDGPLCTVIARNEAIQVILYWIASCFVPRSRNDGARQVEMHPISYTTGTGKINLHNMRLSATFAT